MLSFFDAESLVNTIVGLVGSLAGSCCALTTSQTLTIGRRKYRVLRQLGEGGFSVVSLIEDVERGTQYALKKMICHQGTDAFAKAQREMDAYGRFRHRNIIPMVDALVDETQHGLRTVYMVFPVYLKGNLFDLAMHNEETGTRLGEDQVIHIFRGVCAAVRFLHNYRQRGGGEAAEYESEERQGDGGGDTQRFLDTPAIADERETEPAPGPTASGYTKVQGADPDSSGSTASQTKHGASGITAYAHRDIKLANVMLADDGRTPILMDFGSVGAARYSARTRSDALRIQDDAAENCTMAYRAPELFDVQTGAEFDERTDIWSLGCLLFALAYNFTPFEDPAAGPGASIALAAINGKYTYPKGDVYSDRLRQLVDFMLEPDPKQRPFIDQVIALTNSLYPQQHS
ncbi:Pkinase-domain-containing protein [Martensiomyces pterosporus]|nr:Pkinase-domain-containing protein [Martensiomyces pterosporus]